MIKTKRILAAALLSILTTVSYTIPALAALATSPNYGVSEAYFGSGGELQACSGSYCSKQSAGELAVGGSSSANYLAQAGFNTNREPFLEFSVSAANLNLGILTASEARTGNGTFKVSNYLSGGYVVTPMGPPPTSATGAQITPMVATAASSPGIEQFGINLVANTAPTTFGANPRQLPDATFSFGQAASGYGTANQYKYVMGETIASSSKNSGITEYTLSYIINISVATPTGTYKTDQEFVATATF